MNDRVGGAQGMEVMALDSFASDLSEAYFKLGHMTGAELKDKFSGGAGESLELLQTTLRKALDAVEQERRLPLGSKLTSQHVQEQLRSQVTKLIDHPMQPKIFLAHTGGAANMSNILSVEPGSSSFCLGSAFTYHQNSTSEFIEEREVNKAVSEQTAVAMATSAFYRGQKYVSESGGEGYPIGISLTAAVATGRHLRGGCRFHGAVRTQDSLKTFFIEMESDEGRGGRQWQNAVAEWIVSNAVLETVGVEQLPISDERVSSKESLIDGINSLGRGKLLELKEWEAPVLEGEGPWFIRKDGTLGDASEINSGEYALFPGNHAPHHFGHSETAKITRDVTGRDTVIELCGAGIEKPVRTKEEMQEMLFQFAGWHPVLIREDAPLFKEKIDACPGVKDFVVGYDTAKRILDPKYYKTSLFGKLTGGNGPLLKMLCEQKLRGVRYLVAGRENSQGNYLTVEDLKIPFGFKSLFKPLPTRNMRISSTKLRENTK